jgi:NAD(P)-dependent dehydrogenase (short-subunit alcohol dehydrogenase family)
MGRRVEGKVGLVVGAGSVGEGWGIGKATAALLAKEGASVFAVDYRPEAAQATQALIEAEGGICEVHGADATRADEVAAAVEACLARFGRIDILVNNVGIVAVGGAADQSEADWDRVMNTNVKSMFLTCKYVLPIMERTGGSVVNVSSIASARWAGVNYASYAASKAAVNQFTKSVAMEYARRRIRVNAVLPGLMNTPMIVEPLTKAYGDDVETMLRKRDAMTPMGAMGDGWDVAYSVLYLASDEAKYVTGTLLFVDGGLHCQVVPAVT